MKKQLKVDIITNELRGSSAFFPRYKKEQAIAPAPQKPVLSPEAPPERTNARTTERANGRRIITRNSFEIYEDQMDTLRERAFQEKRQGKIGSMSAMVREAIDRYLARADEA